MFSPQISGQDFSGPQNGIGRTDTAWLRGSGGNVLDEVDNAIMADARDRYRGGDGGRADNWLSQNLGSWPVEVQMQIAQEFDAELDRRVEAQLRAEARSMRLSEGAPDPALISVQALWGKENRLKGSVFATMENVLAGYADPGVGDAAASSEINMDE